MEHQQREYIGMIKRQAYHKGFIDGYQRGLDDCNSGVVAPQADSDLLDRPIQLLNLSTRPFNCLVRCGYSTIRDIVALNREDIWKIRGLGNKGIQEIALALWNFGIGHSEWNFWL